MQICADDALTVAHALRMIVKDARSFAKVRWTQRGFRRSPHPSRRADPAQPDGPARRHRQPATDLDRAVWIDQGAGWLRGGTTLVLRRIRAELETWDAADRVAREFTIGRRLDTGAPLTGRAEHDEPDFERLTRLGFPVISEYAHIRRAHVGRSRLRILRRPYNYDEGLTRRTARRLRAAVRLLPGGHRPAVRPDPATAGRGRPAQRVDDTHRLGGVRHPAGLHARADGSATACLAWSRRPWAAPAPCGSWTGNPPRAQNRGHGRRHVRRFQDSPP